MKNHIGNLLFLAICFFHISYSRAQTVKPRILESEYIFESAPFKSCHASTIVQLKDGRLMAAWFGGTAEGNPDVCIWMSIKELKGWTHPAKLADGVQSSTLSYACWNPVLFKTTAGILYLFYKVGPNPREWWGMYKVSRDNGKSWSPAKRLPDGFLGPIKDKPIQLTSGDILYPSSTESKDEKHWAIHMEISNDDLSKWRYVTINCDTFQTIQPTILTYPRHKLQLLARSKQNVLVQSWSVDDEKTWSAVTKSYLPNPNSGVDVVTLPDYRQLLVYNPLPAGKNWWDGRSTLKLATSNNGNSWQDIFIFEDAKSGEFSYPAIIFDKSGDINVTYTDNRKKIKYVKLRLN